MKKKTVQMPGFQTRALVELETVKQDERTLEIVWTTGARGLRNTWDGKYYEELSLDPKHVDLTRLNAGASILDTHNSWSGLKTVLGVVQRAWIVNDTEARALIKLSDREEVRGTTDDILKGLIRNVSVGYSIQKLVEVGREGDIPVLRAEAWTPFELSFVPIPFDSGASSRSNDSSVTSKCTVITTKGIKNMGVKGKKEGETRAEGSETQETETPVVPSPVDNSAEIRAAAQRAVEEDRVRAREITDIVVRSGLDRSFADRLVTEGKDIHQTRELVLNALADKSKETGTRSVVTPGQLDERDTMWRAMEESLLTRAAPQFNQPTELSQRYRAATLLDMAKDALHAAGVETRGLSKNEIASRALIPGATRGLHTTSDFPLLLGNTVKKVLRDNFAIAPSDYQWMTQTITVNDYRAISRFGLSTGPALLEVKEHGEYKRGTFQETAESMQLKKFGRIVGITREVVINDDLNAISSVPRLWGFAAQQLITRLVWEQITSNPVMSDGLPLFHALHGNLMTGGAGPGELNIANLEVAVGLIEAQKGFAAEGENDENNYLGLQARYLLVGPALKYAAIRLTTSVDPIVNSAVNPFAGLIVKSDPRITGNQWFVCADPAATDAIGILQMAGEPGPQLDERVGFDVDGIEYKVRLDTGAKALDYRWIVKNPGI